jgi:hypothetical protein
MAGIGRRREIILRTGLSSWVSDGKPYSFLFVHGINAAMATYKGWFVDLETKEPIEGCFDSRGNKSKSTMGRVKHIS